MLRLGVISNSSSTPSGWAPADWPGGLDHPLEVL